MALPTTLVNAATLPLRLGVAFTRTTLQLGRLTARPRQVGASS